MLLSYHGGYVAKAEVSAPVVDAEAEAARLVAEKAEADRIEAERVAAQDAEAKRLADAAEAVPSWDDLTDEQVTEAYATNVGGNATARKSQIKALSALDS